MAKKNAVQEKPAGFFALSLSAITVNPALNCRSDACVKAERAGEADNGIEGLIASLVSTRQDTPVHVRLCAETGEYELVSGFRRYQALSEIAKKGLSLKGDPAWDPKTPTINAYVREMTPAEAWSLNVRENTARCSLSAADTMYGVGKIVDFSPKASDSSIANAVGLSQSYISKLRRIHKNVIQPIIDQWRIAPIQLTVEQMVEISKLPSEQQAEAYDAAVKGKEEKKAEQEANGEGAGRPSKLSQAVKMGRQRAIFLGKLYVLGFDIERPDFSNNAVLDFLCPLVNKLDSKEEIAELVTAMNKAFADFVEEEESKNIPGEDAAQ